MTKKKECAKCSENAEVEVRWEPHGSCGNLHHWYCAKHAARLKKITFYCGACGHDPVTPASMNPWPPAPPEPSAYEKARLVFMETGLIADKEAIEQHVTLTEPPDWDIFGSLLAEPAPLPPVPWADRKLAELNRIPAVVLLIVFAALVVMAVLL